MAGEFEQIFLKIGEGDSILVEGGAGSGKEFFCRLLLRQALEAGLTVAVLSFHPEAHLAWFRQFAANKAGGVRFSDAPESLTELGIALNEQAKGCRFAYVDFFETLSSKFEPNAIMEAIEFNATKLGKAKISLLQDISPESVEPRQMARLREMFGIVIEVRRDGDSMEYRYMRHPTEFDESWHRVGLGEVTVPAKTLAEFCRIAMEYELRNVGHYGRSFSKFDDEGKRALFALSLASMEHLRQVSLLLQKEAGNAEIPASSPDELRKILDEGMLEERVMRDRYAEYAQESGDAETRKIFERLSREEKEHEKIIDGLRKKLSK